MIEDDLLENSLYNEKVYFARISTFSVKFDEHRRATGTVAGVQKVLPGHNVVLFYESKKGRQHVKWRSKAKKIFRARSARQCYTFPEDLSYSLMKIWVPRFVIRPFDAPSQRLYQISFSFGGHRVHDTEQAGQLLKIFIRRFRFGLN